jgi:hypothetical protein
MCEASMIIINGGNRATDRDLKHLTFTRLEDFPATGTE